MPEGVVTTDHVTEYGKAVKALIERFKGKPYVKAGVLQQEFAQAKEEPDGEETKSGTSTLGDVAVYNEFGAPKAKIPARSFIRSTADEQRERWGEFSDELLAKVIENKVALADALGLLGLRMQASIQAKIRSNVPPPNATGTIQRKLASSSKIRTIAQLHSALDSMRAGVGTLRETGQLHGSINYAVMDGEREKRGELQK